MSKDIKTLMYEILEYYSPGTIQFEGTQQLNCIFASSHKNKDEHKSARIYEDEEEIYYKCFGCGFYGDVVNIVREMEGITWTEARDFLKDNFAAGFLNTYRSPVKVEVAFYEKMITNAVIDRKPRNFNKIYQEMDKALVEKNAERLEEILIKVRR